MAIGYAHTLFCDRPGCRTKVTVESTRNAAHARRMARTRHGWGCDTAGDFCPADKTTRDTARPRPATNETAWRDSSETSHSSCDSERER